jgi:hypothetical protein
VIPLRLTAFGETKMLTEWAEDSRCSVSANTLRMRLKLVSHQRMPSRLHAAHMSIAGGLACGLANTVRSGNVMSKPILVLDFDGVIHSYTSGWKGACIVADPPVEGAMRFIWEATEHFQVAIFSCRSSQWGGRLAVRKWLTKHFREYWAADRTTCDDKLAELQWPTEKPAARVTIDDRAITFTGTWPSMDTLRSFQPWNKKACS